MRINPFPGNLAWAAGTLLNACGDRERGWMITGSELRRDLFPRHHEGGGATPVYAVYDWFVNNRPAVDWARLFGLGLRQIRHVDLVRHERRHVRITETRTDTARGVRRDVTWETDRGTLHEWYLGEWRQEYFVKKPEDYRIVARGWEEAGIEADFQAFREADAAADADGGIALGQLGRTPLQHIQIDLAGLERFSEDIADENPHLLALLEQLNALKLQEFRRVADGPCRHIKLWENLSIETMGPRLYRRHLVPLYRGIFEVIEPAGRKLHVHYDGKLQSIAADIADLPFDGIDSFTEPPEGDMTTAEARIAWPGKFLWLHPNLGWYALPAQDLLANIRGMARDAGPDRFCLMISEDIPTAWERTVPAVLNGLGAPEASLKNGFC